MRVRRGFLHAGAWALATAAAVTLSWFGVRSVLRSTAYDPPRALPITSPVTGVATSSPPATTRPHRPKPAPTATAPETTPGKPPGVPRATTTASGHTGNVHSYTLDGGRVVLDLGTSSASLVSATPDSGWRMQLWTGQPGWLRVTFTSASGTSASSLFCTWNGHPPAVQAYEN